ncbi:MAG: UDP-N-acetylmuramoyl-L-alanyl-D-glutamate--2,6-diaminopimelate ligase [Candidatus Omnitrophota bacterium]
MKISALLRKSGIGVTPKAISQANDFEVKGITCDSGSVSRGFIFVAIKGALCDGRRFLPQAIAKGASAIVLQARYKPIALDKKIIVLSVRDARLALAKLAAEFYGNLSRKIKVAGVTGTNGKTTITYLIEEIIRQAGYRPGVIGTINYRFCNKVIPAKNTTPGPVQLQSLLSDMRKAGCKYCVMEVSSHALEQARIEGIDFHSAIFTNLTQDHLDYHKTLEKYFEAKAKLFRDLPKRAFAVINNDDSYGRRLKKITRAEVVTYGIEKSSDVRASNLKIKSNGTEFLLEAKGIKAILKIPLIGIHNVYNVLAAAAWALKAGIGAAVIRKALEDFRGVPGRLERIPSAAEFSVFVDYAHTQDALKNVLGNLRKVCGGRIITVFGCGGDRDKTKRPKMGRTVCSISDYAIITSDNPRSERPEKIIADIKRGISTKNFCVIADRRQAILKALFLAGPGDLVLIAGKGHENYQVIKDRILHFDDRETVEECLKYLKY